MKAVVEHVFDGCFYGCPFCSDAGMGPNYCQHPSLLHMNAEDRMIIGYSSLKSQIPKGEKHPIWCPCKET